GRRTHHGSRCTAALALPTARRRVPRRRSVVLPRTRALAAVPPRRREQMGYPLGGADRFPSAGASPMTTVVFACIHNAGRSQMAAAFFNALADPTKAQAVSAGTRPAAHGDPEAL